MFQQPGKSTLHARIEQEATHIILAVRYRFFVEEENPAVERSVNYRSDLLPWDEQVRLLRYLKGYDIQAETRMEEGDDPLEKEVSIRIAMPILNK